MVRTSKSNSSSPYNEAADLMNKIIDTPSNNNNANYNNANIKSFVYNKKGQLTCTVQSYALIYKVWEHRILLSKIVDYVIHNDDHPTKDNVSNSNINVKNVGLLWILLYELFFSTKRSIIGGGALKRTLLQYETNIRREFKNELASDSSSSSGKNGDNNSIKNLPRYVRLNTFGRTSKDLQTIVQRLQGQITSSYNDKKASTTKSSKTSTIPMAVDRHVPDLIVIPSYMTGTLLKENNRNNSNDFVLQDKSSCFPAFCLVHGFDNDETSTEVRSYIDACAAPGNKTSHIAALVFQQMVEKQPPATTTNAKNTIEIYALDRDEKRYKLLKRRMNELVPSSQLNTNNTSTTVNVIPQHKDFLTTTSDDYPKTVRSILLDPSCSGSGIVSTNERRIEQQQRNGDTDDTKDNSATLVRLQKLSGFQITALRHAMTSFPNVDQIVYSTCSMHAEENENVIADVLCTPTDTATATGTTGGSKRNDQENADEPIENETSTGTLRDVWEVVIPSCLSNWERRGIVPPKPNTETTSSNTLIDHDNDDPNSCYVTSNEASCMIRVDPTYDETNGFFVCCLRRRRADNSSKTNTKSSTKQQRAKKTAAAESSDPTVEIEQYGLPLYHSKMFPKQSRSDAVAATTKTTEEKTIRATKQQQDKSDEDGKSKKNKKKNKPSSEVNPTSPSTKDDAPKTKIQKNKKSKKDTNAVVAKSRAATDSEPIVKSTNSNSDGNASGCRKRNKKLEWKHRQHEQKMKRLKTDP